MRLSSPLVHAVLLLLCCVIEQKVPLVGLPLRTVKGILLVSKRTERAEEVLGAGLPSLQLLLLLRGRCP